MAARDALLVEQRVITQAFRAALEAYVGSYAGFSPYVVELTTDRPVRPFVPRVGRGS